VNLPNSITLFRILLVPIFTLIVLASPSEVNYTAAFVFLIAALTDGLDGYLARTRKEITNFGKLIDPIADKLLVTAALLILVQFGAISTWIALIIIGREFSVSGLRMLAAAEGKVIPASLWGKVKTVSQITAVMAFLLGFSFAPFLMRLSVVITILSGVDYFLKGQDLLKSSME